ncbi:Gfo/Idh/MocA family oxidoreductase [uncultured Imperialibacter sp.]|uniref:Gfo/Idh/MocA family protein n=1 Tax=uncultured Imperialibacter sp. TaxID=1672639 RepID=UPI0030D70A2B|tara:strand:- start:50632 stop:51951 length:1320 start_codon:yes stop_codon:yes gene_type:complete
MITNRRTFVKHTTLGLGALTILPSAVLAGRRKAAPSDVINVGLIGCRGQGYWILENHMNNADAQCVALCDVDENVLTDKAAQVEKKQGKKPKLYKDYRDLLADKDIDAVIIGTPDHWHCLPFVEALQAGKDVYVEKPLANSIGEIEVMTAAAKRYSKQVVQVGQQQRSGTHWADIMAMVHEGKLGKLRKIKVWGNFGYGIGQLKKPDESVPAGVDFNTWLGPAPDRTFNPTRFHGSWRMFWDYGGGLMTDWGVHLLDMALWAGKVDYMPATVSSIGGNLSFPNYNHETPDTLSVVYQMKDFVLTWDHTAGIQSGPYNKPYGLAIQGDDATIVANREFWELKPENRNGSPTMEPILFEKGKNYHPEHVRNFLDGIKSRGTTNCTIEMGRMAGIYAHLGNLSLRGSGPVTYDETKRQILNNKAANALVFPSYRKPWVLPKV